MARILIGWELGANQGHVMRVMQIMRSLAGEGHEIALALQNLADLPLERLTEFELYQAPIWPRLLASVTRPKGPAVSSMGDILARLGLDDLGTLPALIAGWRGVFRAFRPDLVIADFAPALLRAAAGRIPSLQVGTGFTVPPSDMERFPPLTGRPPAHDEHKVLECVNSGLARAGEDPLDALPQIFRADRDLPGTFAELDPYRKWRGGGWTIPSTALPLPQPGPGDGDEIFVYGFETIAAPELWKGLKASGLKVRVHVPRITSAAARELAALGFAVEPEKAPFAEIARRSRIVLSHGGHGFVCSAMLAALPQVVTHYDLEKHHHGLAIAGLGVGGHASLRALRAEPLGRSIRKLYESETVQQRARELADRLAPRLTETIDEETVGTVGELLA